MLMGWSSFLMAYEPTGVFGSLISMPSRAVAGSNSGVWGTSCKEPVSTVLQSDSWNIEIQQTRKMDGFIDLLWSVDACFFSKFRDTINGLSWFFWYNPIKGRYTWSVSSNSVCTANWVIICYLSPFTFEPEKSVDGSRMGRIVSLYGILYIYRGWNTIARLNRD